MWKPAAMLRTTLYSNVTFSTTHQVQLPYWLRTVNRTEGPACACAQWFSNTFESTCTLRAFFSSKRFLTCHTVPLDGAAPLVPAAPVSVKLVAVVFQYIVWPPAVRP
jgi:hypothetical protein